MPVVFTYKSLVPTSKLPETEAFSFNKVWLPAVKVILDSADESKMSSPDTSKSPVKSVLVPAVIVTVLLSVKVILAVPAESCISSPFILISPDMEALPTSSKAWVVKFWVPMPTLPVD